MKGVAWDGVGAPQLESAKKAGELISDVSICAGSIHRNQRLSYFINFVIVHCHI